MCLRRDLVKRCEGICHRACKCTCDRPQVCIVTTSNHAHILSMACECVRDLACDLSVFSIVMPSCCHPVSMLNARVAMHDRAWPCQEICV
jgi:hypothetical protein